MPTPFSRRKRTSVIRTGGKNGAAKESARRVGLKPGLDWHKRNFLTEVLIPSLFTKRSGLHANPLFPEIKPDEVCITWIGHASFLLQLGGMNVLIDPNWSMWLSVIKRLKRPGLRI
ncbi:MAG TPA: MBL fold metallo-hydrolase, partial [Chthoniobacterales bacterium]